MQYRMTDYDNALEKIILHGTEKQDRTGVGSISLAGLQCRYTLDQGSFPLISRRKTWPKAVFAELLWFLSGSTNTNDLNRLGAKFWDPWKSKEFEEKHKYQDGDLGPIYGFQLRHFGSNYNFIREEERLTAETGVPTVDLSKKGFDQLAYMVHLLKTDPFSRRIMFNLWNPVDLSKMRLPPCHFSYQVVVDGLKRATGILTQRSADFPIGVPANIQFYSALTIMLAQQADLHPYEFVHNTNDSHIYLDQIDAVTKYLGSPVVDSPQINIRKAKDIYSYRPNDFDIVGYTPGPVIAIPIAV